MPVETYRVKSDELPRDIPVQPMIPLDQAAASAGGIAGGISKIADAGLALWQKLREGDDEKQVLDALSRADDKLYAYRQTLDKDEDYQGREAKFRSHVDKVYGEELGAIQMGAAQKEFARRFYTLGRAQIVGVRQDAQKDGIQMQRQTLQDATDTLMNKALFAPPAEQSVYLKQIDEAFRASVRNGTLSAIQAQAARRATLSRFQYAQADGLVHQSPGAAVAQLRDAKNFEYLTVDQRQGLINRAIQRGESLGAQAKANARADLQDYQAGRAAGQPFSEEETARLQTQSRAAGVSHVFERVKGFYDQVDLHTTGKTLPQLRAAITDLEAKGTTDANAVARVVKQHLTKDEGTAREAFKRDWTAFEKTRSADQPYPKLDRLIADADALGGKELADAVRQRDDYWTSIAKATREPPSATAARIEDFKRLPTLTVEQLEERTQLQAAHDRKLKEFTADPVKAARTYYPTITEAFDAASKANDPAAYRRANDALIDAQKREGVPEHRIRLLTKDQVEAIEAQLQPDKGAAVLPMIDSMVAHFGPRGWPIVKAQLDAGKKLPPMIEALAAIPVWATQERTNLAAAMRLSDSDAHKVLGDKFKVITDRVGAAGTEARASMVAAAGGSEKAALFQNAAERLARHYAITQNMSESQAAKRAWDDVFYKHWDVSVEGLRIPKINGQPVNDPHDVRAAQAAAVKALPGMRLMLPEGQDLGGMSDAGRKRALIEAAGKTGRWVTSADEKGMYFFVGPGIPIMVVGDDGKAAPLYVPYPDRPPPMPTRGHLTDAQRGRPAPVDGARR